MTARPPHRLRRPARNVLHVAVALSTALAIASCSSESDTDATSSESAITAGTPDDSAPITTLDAAALGDSPAAQLPALRTLIAAATPIRRFSAGSDLLGVWICRVPRGVQDRMYNPVDFRLDIDAERATELLERHVTEYFRVLSHGAYVPQFVQGGEVSIDVDGSNRDCVDRALRRAGPDVNAVVVIADAEHASDQSGGWGRPGTPCDLQAASCTARVTGRATYIGASDFHPEWGEVPAVDLQEHEIGHSLGLPHSGEGDGYTSAIDLMSNSASPRDRLPDRRDAPDTLGVNRLALGWIPLADVDVGVPSGAQHTLVPSNAATGRRLLVLPIDDLRFLTVEVVSNSGFNSHLPAPGVVVHEIDQSPAACRGTGDSRPCVNEYRKQPVRSGTAPFTDLLGVGTTWSGSGWAIRVVQSTGDTWTVEAHRTDTAKEQS